MHAIAAESHVERRAALGREGHLRSADAVVRMKAHAVHQHSSSLSSLANGGGEVIARGKRQHRLKIHTARQRSVSEPRDYLALCEGNVFSASQDANVAGANIGDAGHLGACATSNGVDLAGMVHAHLADEDLGVIGS